MGCRCTAAFDKVATAILLEDRIPEQRQKKLIEVLIDAPLNDADWDCEEESTILDHPVIKAIMTGRFGNAFYKKT